MHACRFLNDWERNYHGGFERRDVYRILAAMQENYVAWASGYAPMAIGADLPEAVREFSRTLVNMRPDITLFVCQTVVLDTDLRGSLESVTAPCTILQTAGDMAVPMSAAMFLRDHHHPGIERTRPPPSSLLPPPRGPGDPVGLALNLIIIIIKLAFILLSRNKN